MDERTDAENGEQRRQHSLLAVQVGLAANILLAGLKAVVGVIGQSPALLADGINSTSDVAYGIVVSIFVRLSGKPADHEHPYGHDQLESVATVVVGAFVITTAIAIFWHSVDTAYELLTIHKNGEGASILALVLSLTSSTVAGAQAGALRLVEMHQPRRRVIAGKGKARTPVSMDK